MGTPLTIRQLFAFGDFYRGHTSLNTPGHAGQSLGINDWIEFTHLEKTQLVKETRAEYIHVLHPEFFKHEDYVAFLNKIMTPALSDLRVSLKFENVDLTFDEYEINDLMSLDIHRLSGVYDSSIATFRFLPAFEVFSRASFPNDALFEAYVKASLMLASQFNDKNSQLVLTFSECVNRNVFKARVMDLTQRLIISFFDKFVSNEPFPTIDPSVVSAFGFEE